MGILEKKRFQNQLFFFSQNSLEKSEI